MLPIANLSTGYSVFTMNEFFIIHNVRYDVVKLLGKGKGGYSYLVHDEEQNPFTVKKIHHEKCDYYTFPEDKIGLELAHYDFLKRIGVKMPMMLDFDKSQDIILKEFIDGSTLMEYVKLGTITERQIEQVRDIQNICIRNNINIDYFPTNFVVQGDQLFYVDYELNAYDEKYNFENWGKKYYDRNTPEFIQYLQSTTNI